MYLEVTKFLQQTLEMFDDQCGLCGSGLSGERWLGSSVFSPPENFKILQGIQAEQLGNWNIWNQAVSVKM